MGTGLRGGLVCRAGARREGGGGGPGGYYWMWWRAFHLVWRFLLPILRRRRGFGIFRAPEFQSSRVMYRNVGVASNGWGNLDGTAGRGIQEIEAGIYTG
jgi:hypothetical protein